jgi:cellulose biosynthesis protein BcsQ
VATHLAQAFAARGSSCLLLDMDTDYADVTQALGGDGDDVRTVADLVPVADELGPRHLEGVRFRDAVLGPPPAAAELVTDDLLRRVTEVAASSTDVVVLHLPRALGEITRWAAGAADVVVQVVSLDVLGFRTTTRAVDLLGIERPTIVVNRSARAEVTPGDVRRVFGVEPLATIPHDAAAARAQDHGRLLSRRGRTGRAFDRLAAALLAAPEDAAA